MKAFFAKGNDAVEIRPAATAVVIRQSDSGFEVLLLCRSKKSTFADSVWVFPGGGVEECDYVVFDHGASEPEVSDQETELAARYAAVRETEEECGLVLSLDKLVPYSHWTTPVGPPKRYATWFYFQLLENADDEVVVDNQEIVDFQWLTPEKALEKQARGELSLLPPTFITLEALSRFSDAQVAIDRLKTTEFVSILPKATRLGDTTVMLYPGDAGYDAGDASLDGPKNRFWMTPGNWRHEKTKG